MKPFAYAMLAIAPALFASCAIPPKAAESAPPKTDEAAQEKKRLEQEEKKARAEIASMKLEIAKTAQAADAIESETSIEKAKLERELAERELKQLLEVDIPRRLEDSRLRLQENKDGVQDAKEELAQLEDMYKDGDLADKTREIVLSRGKRGLERRLKRLSLQEIEHQSFENVRLPNEKTRAISSLKEKVEALAKAERGAARTKLEKAIAVKEAEIELAKKEAEIKAKP